MRKKLKEKMLNSIIGECERAAWYGGNSKRTFKSKDNLILMFSGHTYEPTWECFETACCITLNDGTKNEVHFDLDDKNIAPYRNTRVQIGDMLNVRNVVNNHTFFEV